MLSGHPIHRPLAGVIGSGVIAAAMLLGGASLASAEPTPAPGPPGPPPPECTAAELARVSGGVATATSDYLFGHPDVNAFFTSLHGKPDGEIPNTVRDYMNANPQVKTDLTGIRQPLIDFRSHCELAPEGAFR